MRSFAVTAGLLLSSLCMAHAQSSLTLGKAALPQNMEELSHISFSGFRADDLIDLSHPPDSAPIQAAVGEIRDGRLVRRSDVLEFHYQDRHLAISRKGGRDFPVVVVLRLALRQQRPKAEKEVIKLDPLKQATFTTDGNPAKAVLFPYNGPVVLHDGQILSGKDWLSVALPNLKVNPARTPVHLGNGRYRVPGRLAFGAAIEEVKPVVPPQHDWEQVKEDPFVLVKVLIDADGRVRSVDRIQGDEDFVAAVRDALLQWRFDFSLLVPQSARMIETNLPFRFARPGK